MTTGNLAGGSIHCGGGNLGLALVEKMMSCSAQSLRENFWTRLNLILYNTYFLLILDSEFKILSILFFFQGILTRRLKKISGVLGFGAKQTWVQNSYTICELWVFRQVNLLNFLNLSFLIPKMGIIIPFCKFIVLNEIMMQVKFLRFYRRPTAGGWLVPTASRR